MLQLQRLVFVFLTGLVIRAAKVYCQNRLQSEMLQKQLLSFSSALKVVAGSCWQVAAAAAVLQHCLLAKVLCHNTKGFFIVCDFHLKNISSTLTALYHENVAKLNEYNWPNYIVLKWLKWHLQCFALAIILEKRNIFIKKYN